MSQNTKMKLWISFHILLMAAIALWLMRAFITVSLEPTIGIVMGLAYVVIGLVGIIRHCIKLVDSIEIMQRERQDLEEAIKRDENTGIEYQQIISRLKGEREAFVSNLMVYAQEIYEERNPTNETLRKIRHRLVGEVLHQLDNHVSVDVVLNKPAKVLKDVIQDRLRKGTISLTNTHSQGWERRLVEHVLREPQPPVEQATERAL